MNESNPSRRRFTALVGAAVIGGLAGCGGDETVGSPANRSELTGGETGTSGAETTTASDATDQGTGTEERTTTEETTSEETEMTSEEGETTSEEGAGPETTNDPAAAVEAGNVAVRVAHLSPDAPNVDIAVDGTTVLSDVPFDTVSSYLVLSPGGYQVTVTPTGEDDAVFDEELTLEARAYTVAALGEVSGENQSFGVTSFVDEVEPPASDTTSARLLHAAPDAPAVDVTVEGADLTLFDDVAYGTVSDYVSADADDYTLEVRAANDADDGDVVQTFDVSLAGGTVVTAFATGYLDPDGAPADEPFGLTIVTDSGGE